MKIIKMLVHLVAIALLVYLGLIYATYIKSEDRLLWIPGFLSFFGICFNWYLYSKLVNKLSKNKKE